MCNLTNNYFICLQTVPKTQIPFGFELEILTNILCIIPLLGIITNFTYFIKLIVNERPLP